MDDLGNMPESKRRKGTSKLPFKNMLSSIMKERKLTVKEVAGLAGVSPSVVQNWLSAQNPHDLNAVALLAEKLGIPFKRLLLGVDETVDTPTSLQQLYESQDFFDGLAHISIKRLVPRKGQRE